MAALAWPCAAVTLGDAQVRSALGEPLDVRIPLTTAGGESIERACFSMSPATQSGLPGIDGGSVSLERSRSGAVLRLRSHAAVSEPAVALKVRAACPGSTVAEFTREYALLLDPRPAGTAAPTLAVATAVATPPPPRGVLATLLARIGDTLESLARALVPRSSSARREYIAAMRDANPALRNLGERDPIPEGTPVALPDMRVVAPTRGGARDQAQAPAAPIPARQRTAAPARPAPQSGASRPAREASREARIAPRAEAPVRREGEFVLRLSGPQVDTTRSRTFDEPMRQKLRERQLVLDADDQVSALLAMRNSLRQLETRVAELQLKLAAAPPTLAALTPPPPKAPTVVPPEKAAAASAPPPQKVAPVQVPVERSISPPTPTAPAPAPVPPPAPAPSVETAAPSPAPRTAAAPTAEPATAPAQAPQVVAEPPKRAAEADGARKPATRAVPRPAADGYGLSHWLWALVALLAALALWLGLRISRRRREEVAETMLVEPAMGNDEPLVEPASQPLQASPAPQAEAHPALTSDAPLATRFAENSGETRRRYIEERFPEIANGAVSLDNPASVVKGARLFYEDGALPRAVELLQFAIEARPAEARPWLALFEIFRLERLSGEYAELAARFQKEHGASENWRKVQFFGREIDPANPLYREEAANSLETIGPREARRIAAGTAAAAAASYDPIRENWLDAPMDFENEVLANDLRRALMGEAKLSEQDLTPNSMPALRHIEMFTVA